MEVATVEVVPQVAAAMCEPVAAEQQQSVQPATDCAEERIDSIEVLHMQSGEGLVGAGLLPFCPLVRCSIFLLIIMLHHLLQDLLSLTRVSSSSRPPM